ncbi:9811_t:CDS:1, partial [Cetraspora pellucida]
GNLRVKNHYSPKDMHASLEELAEKEELDFEEILTIKTIKAWIGRYSANFKKEVSERVLSENNNNYIAVVNESSKHQKLYN